MEVELKLALPAERVDALRDALRKLDATRNDAVLQDDVFFEHPSREMATLDQAFRLRTAGKRRILTWKGARKQGSVKRRPEHNVEVVDDPTPMLEALGFVAAVRLQKMREAWDLPHVEVVIDRIEGLGHFVEIEARDAEGGEARVEAVQAQLGLGDLDPVQDSYLELALQAGVDGVQLL